MTEIHNSYKNYKLSVTMILKRQTIKILSFSIEHETICKFYTLSVFAFEDFYLIYNNFLKIYKHTSYTPHKCKFVVCGSEHL